MELCALKVRMSCLSLFWAATSVLHTRSSWWRHYLDFRSSLVNVGHHFEVGRVSRATWAVAAASWSTWCAIWYWLRQLANSDAVRGHVTGRKSGVEVTQASQSVIVCWRSNVYSSLVAINPRARISVTVCIFRPAIVAWNTLASDRWYLYFCAVTDNWSILFNVVRRVVLRRISYSGLLILRRRGTTRWAAEML